MTGTQLMFEWAQAPRPEKIEPRPNPVLSPDQPKQESSEPLQPSPEVPPCVADQPCTWDFVNTFPEPLPEALKDDRLHVAVDLESIQALHEEIARPCLALLHDLDAVKDAVQNEIDPVTGRKPRTEKQRAKLADTLRRVAEPEPRREDPHHRKRH